MRSVATLVVCVTLAATGVTVQGAPPKVTPAERAVQVLRDRIVKDRPFSVPPACLTYVTEATTARHVTIAVRERHDHACAGDPASAPLIDRFRVEVASGRIQFLDVIEDEWRDYAEYRKPPVR
jgi:hypothetical protein